MYVDAYENLIFNREVVKYYFAYFVRKGGGGVPPFTGKIRTVVFDGLPYP